MLKKEMLEMYQEVSEQRKQALDMIEVIYNTEVKVIEDNLELLKQEFDMESEEHKDKYNELIKQKEELKETYEKHKKELEEIQIESSVKEPERNLTTVLDAIEYIGTKLHPENDEATNNRIKEVQGMLNQSLSLEDLKAFNSKKNTKQLKKAYVELTNEIQAKLSNNRQYVFPSIYQLKNKIIEILNESVVVNENEDCDFSYIAKVFVSHLCLFFKTININKNGIYPYYILTNIYEVEKLPIDVQFNFKNNIRNIALELYNK